jgi:hypothetical protein
MIRAFTGPTELTPRQLRWSALRMLGCQPYAEVWRSGCAYGIDTLAAWLAFATEADLELYVPAAPHNEVMVSYLAPRSADRVVTCPKEPDKLGVPVSLMIIPQTWSKK